MNLGDALNLILLVFSAVDCTPLEPKKDNQLLNIEIEDATTVDLDGIGTNPSKYFKEEVDAYKHQKRLQAEKHSRKAREANDEDVHHGDKVALQTFVRNHWASCAGAICSRATCPKMMMTGDDWTTCWGEVFEIYREDGPGKVQVGDLVGFHYPRQQGTWLGCAGNQCNKATCPGNPSNHFGFATDENWYRCWGEVFKIYAKGKNLNDTINSNDDIMLFYLQSQLWV